jgi:hypothetical protein
MTPLTPFVPMGKVTRIKRKYSTSVRFYPLLKIICFDFVRWNGHDGSIGRILDDANSRFRKSLFSAIKPTCTTVKW